MPSNSHTKDRQYFESILAHIKRKISLTDSEEELFVSKLKRRRYLKGHYIVQEGDIYKYQTFIISGKVKTFYMGDDGNEHIAMFGMADWWVGDLCSFSTRTPAIFNTQCLDETVVVQINYEDMMELYREIPQMERYFRLIVQAAYGNTTKRIVQNHSMPAKERYLLFSETHPEIIQQIPQYMIASYLGITKEFLSTIKKQLAEELKS
ncbi:Crp/Fnr family transcriptional regulator [uncultured Aquimarina sp.]|uniref:Crp/Fnr family transcriptional regulator n=1 Tax=uncultured Aquimarina sp. TaxID=575652 RepID=UPI002632FE88|nr:Crp/Fnr family transcriptional regulator [uncultured Aquimarina sp.]